MQRTFVTVLIFLTGIFSHAIAQTDDSLKIYGQAWVNVGSEGFGTFWSQNNRYGLFDQNQNDYLGLIGAFYSDSLNNKWSYEAGAEFLVKQNFADNLLYQLYGNIQYGQLKLMAGWQKYTLGQYGGDLSSGSFLISSNPRPFFRMGIGFHDYVDVPFTDGYLRVKGAINNGWLEEDRSAHSVISSPMTHEKFGYISTGNLPVNLYAGISHMAMYGGKTQNGDPVGVDYWATFTGQGSDVTDFRGEQTNAVGEHLGVFDWGFTFNVKDYHVQLYQQKPITDRTGFRNNFSDNKDNFIGLVIETDEKKPVSGLVIEYVRTEQQGGLGVPDPILTDENGNRRLIIPSDPDDQAFLYDYYSSRGFAVENFDTRQWNSFLMTYYNFGYDFGGRVDYYNNSLYRHVYKNRVVGTPLILSSPVMERYSDDPMAGEGNYFVNNRVVAYHAGVKGWISNELSYRVMLTYTENYGQWQKYEGRFNWNGVIDDPNHQWFWMDTKKQVYSFVELNYLPQRWDKWSFNLGIGLDRGELTDNFGATVGIQYQIN
jgi:hypothetical protein